MIDLRSNTCVRTHSFLRNRFICNGVDVPPGGPSLSILITFVSFITENDIYTACRARVRFFRKRPARWRNVIYITTIPSLFFLAVTFLLTPLVISELGRRKRLNKKNIYYFNSRFICLVLISPIRR